MEYTNPEYEEKQEKMSIADRFITAMLAPRDYGKLLTVEVWLDFLHLLFFLFHLFSMRFQHWELWQDLEEFATL